MICKELTKDLPHILQDVEIADRRGSEIVEEVTKLIRLRIRDQMIDQLKALVKINDSLDRGFREVLLEKAGKKMISVDWVLDRLHTSE